MPCNALHGILNAITIHMADFSLPESPSDPQMSSFCPPKSHDNQFPVVASSRVNIGRMTEAKLTDEITVKLHDGFRVRLDRIAAQDRRKPGQWARKILEEAVDKCEQLNGYGAQGHGTKAA